MLKVLSVYPNLIGDLKIDYYVHFHFSYPPSPRPEQVYWRIGNFKNSMLEMKIDRENSELYSVTLTMYPLLEDMSNDYPFPVTEIVPGLPIVDISHIDQWINDNNHEIHVKRYKNHVWVEFEDLFTPSKQIQCERTSFYMMNDEIVGVGFSDLSDQELQTIDEFWKR